MRSNQIIYNNFLQLYYLKEDFNDKLKAVKFKKVDLLSEVNKLIVKLKAIHSEIRPEDVKPLPMTFTINENVEFPENNLQVRKIVFFKINLLQ